MTLKSRDDSLVEYVKAGRVRMRRSFWAWRISVVCVAAATIGCDAKPPAKTSAAAGPARFDGVALKIAVEAGSPLEDAVKLRAAEFDARTGATPSVVVAPTVAPTADVVVASGVGLADVELLEPLPADLLDAVDVRYLDFPVLYRLVLNNRLGKAVAMPLAGDRLALWYRRDLFDDATLSAAFRKQHRRPLAPPVDWDEYHETAAFFHEQAAAAKEKDSPLAGVAFGCVEPMDGSLETARVLLGRAAGYGKGPKWKSFVLDSETGRPLLDRGAFGRALADALAVQPFSPAVGGKPIDAVAARKAFRDGKAAMLLSRVPPTLPTEGADVGPVALKFAVARLPGGRVVFDPKTGAVEKLDQPNRCVYMAGGGWL
ncbi:MAG: hypothetical protein ACRDD1_12175, partial [Planctomycetia bacterium]